MTMSGTNAMLRATARRTRCLATARPSTSRRRCLRRCRAAACKSATSSSCTRTSVCLLTWSCSRRTRPMRTTRPSPARVSSAPINSTARRIGSCGSLCRPHSPYQRTRSPRSGHAPWSSRVRRPRTCTRSSAHLRSTRRTSRRPGVAKTSRSPPSHKSHPSPSTICCGPTRCWLPAEPSAWSCTRAERHAPS